MIHSFAVKRMRCGRVATSGLLVFARALVLSVALALNLVSLATPSSAPAAEPTPDVGATLREAVAVYAEALETEERDDRIERFRRAQRLFATVASNATPTADLYANLGNAALQAEHLGEAVLAYRRALLLDPDHDRATQNLDHVRGLAPDWVPRRESTSFFDSFFRWHQLVSAAERALAAALAFSAAALLLALGIGLARPGLRNAAVLPAVVWLALAGSMVLDPSGAARAEGVVVGRELVARAADSVHSPARFSRPLPIGTEVDIAETREDWLRIVLANGRDGWVRASGVARVAP